MIEGEIFVEVHWKLSIKVSLSIRELARVWYCGLEEFPCISVDLMFG